VCVCVCVCTRARASYSLTADIFQKKAPYLGRMTDAGRDGMAQVSAMQV